jgi:hypothetical protein
MTDDLKGHDIIELYIRQNMLPQNQVLYMENISLLSHAM